MHARSVGVGHSLFDQCRASVGRVKGAPLRCAAFRVGCADGSPRHPLTLPASARGGSERAARMSGRTKWGGLRWTLQWSGAGRPYAGGGTSPG